jgi:hypothetical protein
MARPGMQRPTDATYPAHHHARSSLVPIQDERIWVTLTGPRTPKRGPSIHHSPGSMALHRRAAVREGKPPLGVAYDKTLHNHASHYLAHSSGRPPIGATRNAEEQDTLVSP